MPGDPGHEPIDDGIERLRASVGGGMPLGDLLDALFVRLVPDGAHDDIAMLAIRRSPAGTPSPRRDPRHPLAW